MAGTRAGGGTGKAPARAGRTGGNGPGRRELWVGEAVPACRTMPAVTHVLPYLAVGVVTTGGTLGGVWLTQHGEKERRRHEATLRELDHEHDHRERLQQDRLTAYRDFSRAWMELRRANEGLGVTTAVRNIQTSKSREGSEEERAHPRRTADSHEEEWHAALLNTLEATKRLEEALAGVELVASSAVFEAAVNLRRRTQEAWVADRDAAGAIVDIEGLVHRRPEQEAARGALQAAHDELISAIRTELRLETYHPRSTAMPGAP